MQPWVRVVVVLALASAGCGRDEARAPEGPRLRDHGRVALAEALHLLGPFGRITDVAVDARGRLYAADAIEHSVSVFRADGSRFTTLGRRGRGPGEFEAVTSLAVSGQHLFVLDHNLQRITVYLLGDTITLERTNSTLLREGRTARGALLPAPGGELLVQYFGVTMSFGVPGEQDVVLRRVDSLGALLDDSVAVYRDREWMISRLLDGHVVEEMPFGKQSVVALSPDGVLHLGWTGSSRIQRHRLDGQPLPPVPVEGRGRPLTAGDVEVLVASVLASNEWSRNMTADRWRMAWHEGRLPDSLPAYHGFVVDDAGRVWMNVLDADEQLVRAPWGNEYVPRSDSTRIVVLDAALNAEWQLRLAGFQRVAVVKDGHVYCVRRNELGVETIVVYRITKELT